MFLKMASCRSWCMFCLCIVCVYVCVCVRASADFFLSVIVYKKKRQNSVSTSRGWFFIRPIAFSLTPSSENFGRLFGCLLVLSHWHHTCYTIVISLCIHILLSENIWNEMKWSEMKWNEMKSFLHAPSATGLGGKYTSHGDVMCYIAPLKQTSKAMYCGWYLSHVCMILNLSDYTVWFLIEREINRNLYFSTQWLLLK